MTSMLKRIFGGRPASGKSTREVVYVEDDSVPDGPYISSLLVYLSVVLFIGIPMWFYTCSVTRYSLPNLQKLEDLLIHSPSKLHLDISLIQLSRYDALKSDDDINAANNQMTEYLRAHLPNQIDTSIENVTYNINWRVRRPTHAENRIFQSHQKQHMNLKDQGALRDLESNLVNIHAPSNRFRLFLYLIEQPYYSAYCDSARSHSYTISFERFVYLCPSNALSSAGNYSPVVNLIKDVLSEIYKETVDLRRGKHILNTRMDLLFSLLPETSENLDSLAELTDKIHQIFDKNVKERFPELTEIINIRLITQTVVDLIDIKLLNKIIMKPKVKNDNSTIAPEPRILRVDNIGPLFLNFESRITKHSSQNIHSVLFLVPDPEEPPMKFKREDSMNIIEQDFSSMLLAKNDKSLFLEMRALIRRIAGLTSVNICKNCKVRRDVFFNRWEIDAIMGMLTLTKLQETLISLRSISQQNVGIKIPKDVSNMARDSYELALKSVAQLNTKQTLESYRSATKAYELSESAFYNPSLIESLYFPDDLKYAIYLPLFLPLSVSFILSTLRLAQILYKYMVKGRERKMKYP